MSVDNHNPTSNPTIKTKNNFVSVIYSKNNDSPKYFQVKKNQLLLFVVALPTITLISLLIAGIGLVHTSPFHLIENYKKNSEARNAIAKTNELLTRIQKLEEEKVALGLKNSSISNGISDCRPGQDCKGDTLSKSNSSIAPLSSLSLFAPITNQKDKSKPSSVSITDQKATVLKDIVSFQFNIIPSASGEKLAGYILVAMKSESSIQFYPSSSLNNSTPFVDFTLGEPFATQRFRPVIATFNKPKKAGNCVFTIYIFAKNGDLFHVQSTLLPVSP